MKDQNQRLQGNLEHHSTNQSPLMIISDDLA